MVIHNEPYLEIPPDQCSHTVTMVINLDCGATRHPTRPTVRHIKRDMPAGRTTVSPVRIRKDRWGKQDKHHG